MNILLSIQIPTTFDRRPETENLIKEFRHQALELYEGEQGLWHEVEFPGTVSGTVIGPVEIMYYEDGKQLSVGEKRDRMYRLARGKYTTQWDSDDWIPPFGLAEILNALKEEPDCVTYEEHVNIDGVQYRSNHSLKYRGWEGDGRDIFDDGYHFHRTPFFKSVIRTDYCQHIGVSDIRFGEDHEFAILIKPMLMSEVHIDKEIYIYRHRSTAYNERYGIKP